MSSRPIGTEEELPRTHTINHPINPLLAKRFTGRAFDESRPVEPGKMLILLEAARWAPSSFNEQPWRYLVFDGSDQDLLERARRCLNEGNGWARKAPVLMLSVASRYRSGKVNPHAEHDVGLASENLVIQAVELGLIAPQIAGFDVARARSEFSIPDEFTPMAMIAIGYPFEGSLDSLPDNLRIKLQQPRIRKLIPEFVFSGMWNTPFQE